MYKISILIPRARQALKLIFFVQWRTLKQNFKLHATLKPMCKLHISEV